MNRIIIIIVILLTSFLCKSQNSWYVKLNSNPRLSWSNYKGAKINPTNSITAIVGYEFSNKISFETGLYLNRVGFRLKRTVDVIGVNCGFNSYLLKGEIPVKQNFTERFIGIPIQINYKFFERQKFRLFGYSNLAINFYNESYHKWWYYYQTDDEFVKESTGFFYGIQKVNLSYELGAFFEQNLSKGFSILGGINYLYLYSESKFPLTPEKNQYFNYGLIIGLRCDLQKKSIE